MDARYYKIGAYCVEITGLPFRESEHLAAFRTERCRTPALRLTLGSAEDALPLPQGFSWDPSGTVSCLDAQGRRVRYFCSEQGEDADCRVCETEPGVFRAELAPGLCAHPGTKLVLRCLDLPRAYLQQSAMFLHASYIAYRGKAILFTAPKQTGKSTQARLWEQYRGAEQINGDRALLCKEDGIWRAYGSPFCGSSTFCENRTMEIAAIAILRQGPKNVITQADPRQVLLSFLEGITYDVYDRAAMETVLNYAQDVAQQVPFYCLSCLPDEGAVACLHQRLLEESIYD